MADGLPIYVIAPSSQDDLTAINQAIEHAASEAGKPAKVVLLARAGASPGPDALNPVALFLDEPDACMTVLMKGAGVHYLGAETYSLAKRVGREALQRRPACISTLVDAWLGEPALEALAEATTRAFLPKASQPPPLLTGALLRRLFSESTVPPSDMQTEAEVASWWKHYAGRVRNALTGGIDAAPEAPPEPPHRPTCKP